MIGAISEKKRGLTLDLNDCPAGQDHTHYGS